MVIPLYRVKKVDLVNQPWTMTTIHFSLTVLLHTSHHTTFGSYRIAVGVIRDNPFRAFGIINQVRR